MILKLSITYCVCILLFKFNFSIGALPTQGDCGKTPINPSISGSSLNRIINGEDAVENSWPWQVSLRLLVSDRMTGTFCGGKNLQYNNLKPIYLVWCLIKHYTYLSYFNS